MYVTLIYYYVEFYHNFDFFKCSYTRPRIYNTKWKWIYIVLTNNHYCIYSIGGTLHSPFCGKDSHYLRKTSMSDKPHLFTSQCMRMRKSNDRYKGTRHNLSHKLALDMCYITEVWLCSSLLSYLLHLCA